jgi:hypothetical protein
MPGQEPCARRAPRSALQALTPALLPAALPQQGPRPIPTRTTHAHGTQPPAPGASRPRCQPSCLSYQGSSATQQPHTQCARHPRSGPAIQPSPSHAPTAEATPPGRRGRCGRAVASRLAARVARAPVLLDLLAVATLAVLALVLARAARAVPLLALALLEDPASSPPGRGRGRRPDRRAGGGLLLAAVHVVDSFEAALKGLWKCRQSRVRSGHGRAQDGSACVARSSSSGGKQRRRRGSPVTAPRGLTASTPLSKRCSRQLCAFQRYGRTAGQRTWGAWRSPTPHVTGVAVPHTTRDRRGGPPHHTTRRDAQRPSSTRPPQLSHAALRLACYVQGRPL